MTLTQYLRVLRQQWVIVVLLAGLGLGGAAAYTLRQVPVYSAQIQLFVSARDPDPDISQLSQGSAFTQQRVKSYSDLATSPIVAQAVIDKLHLSYTAEQLSSKITADTPLDTVLLNISVSDPDPQRAAAIANAVGSAFPHFIAKLETQTGQVLSPVTVSVTRRAMVPTAPISPRVPLNLALGLIVGLGLGIGAGVLRDQMNTTVTGIGDLERLTGSIPLGVVPYDAAASKQPLVAGDQFGGRAESFRTLRTNLQFADVDDPPRVITITSPLPTEGKTTTACNVALTLAQSGARVILVEGDLRKPSVSTYLGISNAAGLTNVLAGQHELRDVIVSYHRDTLAVLPSGPTPPNPSELLGSQQMRHLLATLANHYDMVIIDAPPLLPVTDAAVLAVAADGAILVVRYGKSRREEVERSLQALASVNAKVLGTVLNFAPRKKRGVGYDGYGYGYGYGPTTATPEPATASGSGAGSAAGAGSGPGAAAGAGAAAAAAATELSAQAKRSRRGRGKSRADVPATRGPVHGPVREPAAGAAAASPGSVTLPPMRLPTVTLPPADPAPAGRPPAKLPAANRIHATQPQAEQAKQAQQAEQAEQGIGRQALGAQTSIALPPIERRPTTPKKPADPSAAVVDLATASGAERLIPPQGGYDRPGTGVPRHHRSKRSL